MSSGRSRPARTSRSSGIVDGHRRRLGAPARDRERPARDRRIAGQSEAALHLIDDAVTRAAAPAGRRALGYGSPNGFTRRVFAAGADDVVILPVSPDEVLFALQKAIARKAGGAESATFSRAPLICVLGPKGGTGKTLTSTSLAVALAELGKSVALVDLDLQFGDVGLCMGVCARARRSSTSCAPAARSTRRSSTAS